MGITRTLRALLLILPTSAFATPTTSPYELGLAKVDITPREPLRLSGYSDRTAPFDGIDGKLWARALVLRSPSGETNALVTVESIGLPGEWATEISRRIQKRFAIPRERFVLCSTHTHTAPQLAGCLTNLFAVPLTARERSASAEYTRSLGDAVVEVVGKAITKLSPGRLHAGEGSAAFAVNRRVLENGRWKDFGVHKAGPVDHSVAVLKVTALDGSLLGVVFNYACHCTTLTAEHNRVGGDWAGHAAELIETRHSGAIAVSTIGCGADANPRPRGSLETARAHGSLLADSVGAVLSGAMRPVTGRLKTAFGYAGLPVDRPPISTFRRHLESPDPQLRRRAEYMVALYQRMGRLPETYPAPIQTWKFADQLTMVFLGGEVVVDYALRLKEELDAAQVWITAYANDVFGYLASERVRQEGGYEVDGSMIFYNQPGPWAEGTEELVVRRVHEILATSDPERALSPTEALRTFRLPDELVIEVVASEPLITDPVNFDFAPDGKLWVVEMRDYPRGMDGAGKPGGRVKALENVDGDGVFDRATIFLDELALPTGVTPWREGVLVSCAPDIFYAEDTDGDGKADRREVILTGFHTGNGQHLVNGFSYGLDHWLHLGSGTANPDVRSVKSGQAVNARGRDVRFRPDDGFLEAVSGRSQYGRSRDDWGNWFGCDNSLPMYHYVIPDRYLRRNPHVATPDVKVHLIPGHNPPVFPTSRTVDRFNDLHTANRFTSACGVLVFRDPALGEALEGAGLICEPVHNLVHRLILREDGVTFRGERLPNEEAREFLTSTDTWFRPVRAATGPDGALWLADMYRHVIEHPQWIPEDWQARLDVRAGQDKGRIYRIFRRGERPGPLPALDKLTTDELAATLAHPNGWRRDTAQRLLVHQNDMRVVPRLVDMATAHPAPIARLHALATLDAMAALAPDVLGVALADRDARVVRRAVLLAEPRLASNPALREQATALAEHDALGVRFQLALALGTTEDPACGKALTRLARRDGQDTWMLTAVLSSAGAHSDQMLADLLDSSATSVPHPQLLERLIATALGEPSADTARHVLSRIAGSGSDHVSPWQIRALAAFLDGSSRRGLSLETLLGEPSPGESSPGSHRQVATADSLAAIFSAARSTAANVAAEVEERMTAMRLLGRGREGQDEDHALLARLLSSRAPPRVQSAAIQVLGRTPGDVAPRVLLGSWRRLSPSPVAEALGVLLSRVEWTQALLDALERDELSSLDLDASARNRLLSHSNSTLRTRAERLLGTDLRQGREEVLASYEGVHQLVGNLLRGWDIFGRSCANCHRVRERGNHFGADLASLQDKSSQALLVAVLDPNQAVEGKYRQYVAVLSDGRVLNGMVAAESANSITLAQAEGIEEVILRKDLKAFTSSDRSFMPEGLEKDLNAQDLADVFAFIRSRPRASHTAEKDEAGATRNLFHDAGWTAVADVRGGNRREPHRSFLGKVTIARCGSAADGNQIKWRSRPLTGVAQRRRVRFPAATGGRANSKHQFVLSAGGRDLLRFSPKGGDARWTDADGTVSLHYLAMEVGHDQTAGVFEVEAPEHLLGNGATVELGVTGAGPGEDGWFGVMADR